MPRISSLVPPKLAPSLKIIRVGISYGFVETLVWKSPSRLLILLVDLEFTLRCLVSSLRETKNARKAIPAVMMIPTSADINNQYVSHRLSINIPERTRPEARMMVTTIITTVRQRDNAKTIFWDHRTLICQMTCIGIAKTSGLMSASMYRVC